MTLLEWYDKLITEKQSQASLNDLAPAMDSGQTLLEDVQSTSKVARWRLMLWVAAFAAWILEELHLSYLDEMKANALTMSTGTAPWLRQKSFEFQLGDDLVWNGTQFVYSPIDPSKQIVKRAAVQVDAGQVRVKVAKLISSSPGALSGPEKDAFEAYINSIAIAGSDIIVTTGNADDLKVVVEITRNKLVLDATGLSLVNGNYPVIEAIDGYVKSLEFNGKFNKTKLVDAIQKVDGVEDVNLIAVYTKYGALSYSELLTNNYVADSGYMALDVANSTLTYV